MQQTTARGLRLQPRSAAPKSAHQNPNFGNTSILRLDLQQLRCKLRAHHQHDKITILNAHYFIDHKFYKLYDNASLLTLCVSHQLTILPALHARQDLQS